MMSSVRRLEDHLVYPNPPMEALSDKDTARLRSRWRSICCIEKFWAQVAKELDSQDPVHPGLRTMLTDIKSDLRNFMVYSATLA